MNNITVLTHPTCSYCHAAKSLLKQQGVAYQEVDLVKQAEIGQQLLIKSGRRTVPQIFINDKPIGGFTELSQLVANDEFDLATATVS